jgi:hypothetical protein
MGGSAKKFKSSGFIRGDGHIVSIYLEKSLKRSSGSSNLCDHEDSWQDVHGWLGNYRTWHGTERGSPFT